MMFTEEMTDSARLAMRYANQEAQKLNHEYIGTEHILLGIIKECQQNGDKKLLGSLDLNTVRISVRKLIKAGTDMITMGRLPLTPRAKRVITAGEDIASFSGHKYLGIEHLMYGLLVDQNSVAFVALKNTNESEISNLFVRLHKDYGLKFKLPSETETNNENKLKDDIVDSLKTKEEFFHEFVLSLANSKNYDVLSRILLIRDTFLKE